MAFAAGSTAVRCDVLAGKVLSAAPHRVLHDRDGELLLAHWPGIESLAQATWIEWLKTGDDGARKQIPDLVRGDWKLGPWTWRDTTRLSWFGLDPDFSLHFFRPVDGDPPRWYVNFERPSDRTAIGIATFDLLLDLVANADLSQWRWKDEDEDAEGRRLSLVTDPDHHRRVTEARPRAVALLETRGGPLARDWSTW